MDSYHAVKVICDRVSGKSRGYGFVRYTSEVAASKALKEMDGRVCSNIQIHCLLLDYFILAYILRFSLSMLYAFAVAGWQKYPYSLCAKRVKARKSGLGLILQLLLLLFNPTFLLVLNLSCLLWIDFICSFHFVLYPPKFEC